MPKPEKLKLNPEEQALLEEIVFGPPYDARWHENARQSCEAASQLATSLMSRNAVPKVRLRWFEDPQLQLRTKMSRMQIIQRNVGPDVLTNPAFLPHLKYFIFGPELPADVIEQFCAKVESWPFVSDSTYGELIDLARAATRRYSLSPHSACDEFWKLALECDVDDMYARIIRDAVLRIRSSLKSQATYCGKPVEDDAELVDDLQDALCK
jgi:hypothetical protein